MAFAIIASPRTGSTHLSNLLHAQKDIFCNGEICHAKDVHVRWEKADKSEGVISELTMLRAQNPREFLDRVYAMNYGRREVGFKILRGQIAEVFDELFRDSSIKKVVLFRRNVLANYSSKVIAAQSGEYALRKKNAKERPQPAAIRFDENEFVKFHRKYNRYYENVMATLRQSRQYYHLINYEDINEPEFFGNLLRFLGSEGAAEKIEGRNVKQNRAHILSRFSNADKVEEFLRNRNLMHWAYEGEVSLDPLWNAAGGRGNAKSVALESATAEG